MTIKELRKEKGLTQAAFAQSIGVSVPSIGGYEAGRIHPSAKVLDKIKEVYGLEIAADTSEKSRLNAKVCANRTSSTGGCPRFVPLRESNQRIDKPRSSSSNAL